MPAPARGDIARERSIVADWAFQFQGDVVALDGTVKLSVNGKFVNGVSKSSVKKGYLCLESEGAEIHFRKIQLMELLPGGDNARADRAGGRGSEEGVVDFALFDG